MIPDNDQPKVPVAMLNEQARDSRSGSLFGAHPGSVIVREGIDLTAPVLEPEIDSERS